MHTTEHQCGSHSGIDKVVEKLEVDILVLVSHLHIPKVY